MIDNEAQTFSRTLTRFGALVLALAAERGITSQTKLAAALRSPDGEALGQRRMSGWLHGSHEAPWWFCEALADTLSLSDEEMKRLAWANTYWQKTPLVEES